MKIGEAIRNYIYGDPSRRDYTLSDMPENRRQLFGAALRIRFFSLIGLNLLYILIWLPALLWGAFNLIALLRAETVNEVYGILIWTLLGMLPLITITGPFTMGVARVTRNWARDEHAYVIADFKDGMKKNWKRGFLFSFFTGLVTAIGGSAVLYYVQMASFSAFYYVPMVIVMGLVLVWSLMDLVIPMLVVTYDLKVGEIIRNALILTITEFPIAFGVRVLTLVVPVATAIICVNNTSFAIAILSVAIALYVVLMPAFNRFLAASYANMACEKHINPGIDGAKTDIGLRPKNIK